MLAKLSLSSEKPIILPSNYNEVLQGFIYRNVEPRLASALHDQGFISNGRAFKLFTFSRIFGKPVLNPEKTLFIFGCEAAFAIASPMDFFLRSLISTIAVKPDLRLHNNDVKLTGFEITDNTLKEEGSVTVKVETLSPVAIYSTLQKPDGKRFTRYYFPSDREYSALLTDNLKKKAAAMNIALKPSLLRVKGSLDYREKAAKYKNYIIKGYEGELELTGDTALINIALECGLGGKNSMGFGCIIPL
jgi:CRISPR-associated endoribonuclease Cas6